MKTAQLIKQLCPTDIREIKKLMVECDKKRLVVLLDEISNNENESKEYLFKKVFKKQYTENKDYLLRNELRLLNEIIEDFIVTQDIQKDNNKFYKQRILLQKYLENDSKELFLQLYKEAFENIKDHVFSKQLEDLLDLKSKWHAKNFPYWSEQNFEFYKEYMAYKDRIYNYCLQIYYKYNSKINIASYNIELNQSKDKIKKQIGNKEFVENEILPHIPFKDLEPYTIAIYYDGKSCNMNYSTLQRVEHLKQAVVYLKESPEYVFGFYERLAHFYLHDLKDLTNLYHYRKEAYLLFLNLIDKPQAIYHTGAISKYIIACIYTKKHEEAINAFEKHLTFLEKNCREITNLKLIIIVAYIMLDNIDSVSILD